MVSSDSLSDEHSLTEIADLQPGDHLCCIYETEEEHRDVLTPFIKKGLEANEKVIYIVDTNTAEEIVDYLREVDYPPEPYLDSGQLVLLTQDQSYLKGGTFDPDAMIELLREETEKALDQDYDALRVTGEMTWALRGQPGTERLMEYENKLNRFFPNHQALGLCQYDRNRFNSEVLLDVLRTHPIAVVGDETYENFHYIPPEKLLGESPKEAELCSWEEGLSKSKGKKLRLQHLNSLLRAIRNLNQIIVQEEDLEPLMKKACKSLLETRRYLSVNLALLEETTGKITPFVQVGDKEFDRGFSISPDGKGDAPVCVKKALSSGTAQVVSSEKECLNCDYGNPIEDDQALTVPLTSGGEAIGVLHIWTDQEMRIDVEEKDLLTEAAGDLALAWKKIGAETRLRKSEREKSLILQHSPALMVYQNLDHEVIWANKKAGDSVGEESSELVGRKCYKIWHGRETPCENCPVERAIETGGAESGEIESPDGRVWLITGAPAKDEEGNTVGLIEVTLDITEKKKALRRLEQSEHKLRQSFIELAQTTSRVLGVRDPYTREHEQRVGKLAREVGKQMGLDEEELLGLYIGGLLHDIGKIAIPETILTKPGELTDVEWEMIKSHPQVGYDQILHDTDFPWPVAEITLHHHERLDGSGYPDGLEGEELTTEVRILGAVDVVEAMSTRRPYREARSKERTLKVLKEGKGDKFDPEVVDILVEMIEEGKVEFGER